MKVKGIEPQVEVECELMQENKGSNEVERVLKPLDAEQRAVVAQLLNSNDDDAGVSVGIARVSGTIDQDDDARASGPTMLVPLQQAGVTPVSLANVLLEGLKARKHVVVSGRVKRVPDHAVRLRFLELAHKLRGDYPAAQQQQTVQHESYEARILSVMKRVQGKMLDTVNDR